MEPFAAFLGYVTSTRYTDRDWARRNLFSKLEEDEIFDRPTYKGTCSSICDMRNCSHSDLEFLTLKSSYLNLMPETPVQLFNIKEIPLWYE